MENLKNRKETSRTPSTRQSAKKKTYWDTQTPSSEVIYPQFEPTSFKSFVIKIFKGLVFSFLPSLTFSLVSSNMDNFLNFWGFATFLVAGIYFIASGWGDLSRTSVRKSFGRYEKRKKITRNLDSRFKFELGLFQFGNMKEDIGAAICLLGIAAMMLNWQI